MKTISHYNSNKLLHVETPLGIVNIRVGLTDRLGRSIDSVEVTPSNYAGHNKVKRSGFGNTRLIQLKTRR
jgi:hypothetical protein|tara:strand:+ start:326 stop:535 length:210 start_codon:yes stop_codon:yes gene_type:complete